ncbi:MAG: SUMF1/EgtB/PvdO family nonheme iron enzyme [Verrucomicrobiae bacterium]|nr:SUMF1/EgtB/PvdO family nonheme iron enzyme [Verrucomicrobiae bacterium]
MNIQWAVWWLALPLASFAADPPYYQKQATWEETIRVSREALAAKEADEENPAKNKSAKKADARAKAAARQQIWSRIIRDFPGAEDRDGIWTSDWRAGDFKALANRYVGAMIGPLQQEARKLAATAVSPRDLENIRKLYRRSRVFRDAIQRLEDVDPKAVARALDDMARTWPERCDAARHRQLLDALKERDALLTALRECKSDALGRAEALLKETRAALLANPLLDFDKLLVLKRGLYVPATRAMSYDIGQPNNWRTDDVIPRKGVFRDELAALSDLRGEGRFQTIYAAQDMETLFAPDLSFDGDRILFSKKSAKENGLRIWEIGVDGKGLRQVTPDDGDDVSHMEPCYLPNGDIMFTSTAIYKGIPCVFGSDATASIYRLDTKTGRIRQLTFEQDSDWCPTVMPSGRVMYLRWEYTDQSHANSRILFHMNPDGTDQRELRGRGSWFPGSFFHAMPIPGTAGKIIGIAGGHHDVGRSGRLLIFDTEAGRRDGEGVREIPGYDKPVEPIVRDGLTRGECPQFLMPYPLSEKYHLVACKRHPDSLWGIYMVDVFDNFTLVKEAPGAALLEPIPLRRLEPPPVIPDRVDLATNEATVHIQDIYEGPGLAGVARGTVKSIRLIEYYFSRRGMGGLYGTLGMDGPWDIKRIIGTVPVEPDGSAHFKMPANTPISLQPLDEKGQALQLMRSWLVGMPGERVSCVGCHEQQGAASLRRETAATKRAPSAITPWHGPTRGFSFVREVQPVLDRYCIGCHDGRQAQPTLKGDEMINDWKSVHPGHWSGGGKFTKSYAELHRYLRRPGIEGDRRMLSPMDFHFSTTELGQMLRKGHHGVRLDAEAWERLAAWLDLNAPFYGTWGEIPQFKQGHGPPNLNFLNLNFEKLAKANARAMELRRRYVPMGPHPDYEAIPQTPKYDTTPVKPAPESEISDLKFEIPAAWPFSAEEAARRQRQTAPAGSNGVFEFAFENPKPQPPSVTARYLRVNAGPARWLSVAEAEAFSNGRNVALKKKATQSSTYGGAGAERGVDGNTSGNWSHGSITHTMNGEKEWWEVDLGALYPVQKIVLWNRSGIEERLASCLVELMDEKRAVVWSDKTPAKAGQTIVLISNAPQPPPALRFVWVPPGEFVMGSRDGHPDERPLNRVKIARGFWMSAFEITNDQFKRFDPAFESREEDRHGYQFGIPCYDQDQPAQPAVRVSWTDAMRFCAWLSRKLGRKVTLPTEAQWEWACRAGTATPFWYGDMNTDFSKLANLGDFMLAYFSGNPYVQDYRAAWYKNPENKYDNWIPQDARFNDDGFVTEPVGRYKANPWGLHDMHGNAWEWTQSAYRPYPYRDDDGRNVTEGVAPDTERVVRGGSWYDRPFRCTSSFRLPYRQYQRIYNVGFRVVCEPESGAVAMTATTRKP